MKEARIVIPDGGGTRKMHILQLQDKLIEAFGGTTTTLGYGRWNGPHGREDEDVVIIDVAYETTRENDAKLFDMVQAFRNVSDEKAVYLRYGNGTVQMVGERGCMDNGEKEPFDWEKLRQEMGEPADDLNDVSDMPEHVDIGLAPL